MYQTDSVPIGVLPARICSVYASNTPPQGGCHIQYESMVMAFYNILLSCSPYQYPTEIFGLKKHLVPLWLGQFVKRSSQISVEMFCSNQEIHMSLLWSPRILVGEERLWRALQRTMASVRLSASEWCRYYCSYLWPSVCQVGWRLWTLLLSCLNLLLPNHT